MARKTAELLIGTNVRRDLEPQVISINDELMLLKPSSDKLLMDHWEPETVMMGLDELGATIV